MIVFLAHFDTQLEHELALIFLERELENIWRLLHWLNLVENHEEMAEALVCFDVVVVVAQLPRNRKIVSLAEFICGPKISEC